MNHSFISKITFDHCDEPGVLAMARIELASAGEPFIIDESRFLRNNQGHLRLEMPTFVHSSDGSLVLLKLPKRLYETIQADVVQAFQSWLREEQ